MSLNPEHLLAHADFVRYLARSLLLDENQADDVAQDTYLKALTSPPRAAEAMGTWLDKVTRNFAKGQKKRHHIRLPAKG